jgi:hypothetical protein
MGIAWTLRARGLVSSLGAGGSLVVAGVCCLLLATALLTFRDWPGRGDSSPRGTIAVPAPAEKAAGRAASGPVAPVAAASTAPAARRRGAAVRGTRPVRRAGSRTAPAAPSPPAGTDGPAPSGPVAETRPTPGATHPVTAAEPDAPATDPQPGLPLPDLPLPDPQSGQVEQLVETVRQVEEPLPPVVREPVRPVLDTVQQVGHTVDETVGPVLPALP